MCTLQATEFVFVSFAVEMDWVIPQSLTRIGGGAAAEEETKDGQSL